ncbi:MAG: EAL domain-containing protein [Pseudomonadota bacterium]
MLDISSLSGAWRTWFRQQVPNLAIETFQETQRRRLIQANMLAVMILLVVCISEMLVSSPSSAGLHLLIALPVLLGYAACHMIATRRQNVRGLARLWMATGCIALWFDITISGGMNAPTISMLYLLPIGSALMLGLRDIMAVSVANIAAILAIAAVEIAGPLGTDMSVQTVLNTAGLMVVNSLCISITVLILVLHSKRMDEALRNSLAQTLHISDHDQLTGLLNRKWVSGGLENLDRRYDQCELLIVDLDGFKQVNDLHGHAAGDALLQAVAGRLKAACPKSASVARLGGDEFVVVLHSPSDIASSTAEEIVLSLALPYHLGNLEVGISASVGQASFPADAHTGEQLLARADAALYAAKNAGKNQFVRFEDGLERQQQTRSNILRRLRIAIAEDQIHLHYQPQYRLADGLLTGFEALARWDDEELGAVSPDEFIPIAEECGLIAALGENVLRRACKEARHWALLSDPANDIRLSINLSPLQLSRSDIVATIQTVLEETGFPASRLELEITERILISDRTVAEHKLKALSELGIGIALDDFGKGYASLSYLQSLSLTRLKIDRSVSQLHDGEHKGLALLVLDIGNEAAVNLEPGKG